MRIDQKPPNAPVILIVEDETAQLEVTAEAFRDAGFVALAATDAGQALAMLGDLAEFVDVLFTDIELPGGMNGMFLASYVRQRWPRLGIAVTSGKAKPSAASLPKGARYFSKPFADRYIGEIREMALAAA
jgi:CheY-like chemotaxis protein